MDISKCKGRRCPMKTKCLRFTVKAEKRQSWNSYDLLRGENGACNYFMEVK
jgi:hypothetical protein